MNNHLRELAKERFKVSLDALPEREHRVVQHFGERLHISRDTNLEFEKELTFGQRLADKAELEILSLHEKLDELRDKKWVELLMMQQEQIGLLTQLMEECGVAPGNHSASIK